MLLAVRAVAMILLFPGTVLVYVPYRLLVPPGIPRLQLSQPRQLAAAALIAIGVALLLRCVWSFAATGRGTLAPFDETEKLVVDGPYRYVRNPMYVAVMLVLLGEAWLFWSSRLLIYAGLFFALANLFVIAYEENRLRHKYGVEFVRYCQSVGRWLPGRPYSSASPEDGAEPSRSRR